MNYRRRSDGKRMGVEESHLLSALYEADDWLDLADLWRRATVPADTASKILWRNNNAGYVMRQMAQDRESFRLTPRGRDFVARQQRHQVAKLPFGLDLAIRRKVRR